MKQVMVDIETLSTQPGNALILSVGACEFTMFSGGPVITAHPIWVINPLKQIAMGRHIDYDGTVKWWRKQGRLAMAHWADIDVGDIVGVETFLYAFGKLVGDADEIWAKPPSFDVVHIESLYHQAGHNVPWNYRAPRCVRTALDLPKLRTMPDDIAANAVKHDPLSDCTMQVWQLWEVWPKEKL